jgi:hypothetical protein
VVAEKEVGLEKLNLIVKDKMREWVATTIHNATSASGGASASGGTSCTGSGDTETEKLSRKMAYKYYMYKDNYVKHNIELS